MKFKHMLVSALLALSAQALAEPAPPIKVETSNHVHPAGTRYVTVVVTSLDDSINVENVDVNRGNCRIDNQKYLSSKNKETILPVTLRYGQSVSVNFYNNCVASEVVVTTDKGGWRYTYH
ncbi:hypothetical protein [Kosakonia radicincitans]|uniref:hypothetical protein n=1 Tax=Kosakonia radicincitans TaxID=283686 RepID=UPI0008BF3373|nr:hypothetical protein [Kosakonia radicincitans]SET69144.1 hypothetical protein SAMN03159294_5228 [Kosakonia radicincitans]